MRKIETATNLVRIGFFASEHTPPQFFIDAVAPLLEGPIAPS